LEEITITQNTNYQNDSLANDYDYSDEDNEENEEEEDNAENEEDQEENNKKNEYLETIDLQEIKNPNNKEKNNSEKNSQNNLKKINKDDNKNTDSDYIKDKEDDDNNNNEIQNSDEEEHNNNNNNDKVKIYLNNENPNNDKISFCHFIFQKGIDIDISKMKIFTCQEKVNGGMFFTSKKYNKIKTLLFIDEHYLYFLKDKIINKKNETIRRINDKYDLSKLFSYSTNIKENKIEYSLNFLVEDNFLDRKIKNLLFEEKEGEIFEHNLLETLDKIDTVFIYDDNEEEEEEGEEEEETEDKNDDKNNKNNKIEEKEKDEDNKEKNQKKIYLRNMYGVGDGNNFMDSKSSSRFMFKKF